MARQLSPYRKLPTSTIQQCDALQALGLDITDRATTIKRIESVGYYRLKGYFLPFRDSTDPRKPFHAGTTFEDVWQLYEFDDRLRMFVFSLVSKIEVGVRAKINQAMAIKSANPFWYIDSELFGHGNVDYSATVNKVRTIFLNSHEEYALHYKTSYHNEFCRFLSDMPPGWVAIELMSFGNLSSTLRSIEDDVVESFKLDRVASRDLGVSKFRKLCNWLGVIHEVRNHCGHHGRLFNRNLRAPDAVKQILDKNIPLVKVASQDGHKTEDQLNRLYTAMAAMQQILRKVGHGPIGPELLALFERYHVATRMRASMGFPQNWETEKLFFSR